MLKIKILIDINSHSGKSKKQYAKANETLNAELTSNDTMLKVYGKKETFPLSLKDENKEFIILNK